MAGLFLTDPMSGIGRENAMAMERQAALDTAEAMTMPFFESDLASVLAEIQGADGIGQC